MLQVRFAWVPPVAVCWCLVRLLCHASLALCSTGTRMSFHHSSTGELLCTRGRKTQDRALHPSQRLCASIARAPANATASTARMYFINAQACRCVWALASQVIAWALWSGPRCARFAGSWVLARFLLALL